VHRAWDLGVRDDTSIWWFQVVGGRLYILDCYTNSGAGVEHYAEEIAKRRDEHGWLDGNDYVPHDAKVLEWGAGRTRVESAIACGLKPIVVPMATKADGIQAARKTIPLCLFHPRCEEVGIAALEQYRREWDDDKKCFRANELHDWTSHLADAFRYLSLAWRTIPVHIDVSIPRPGVGQTMLPLAPEDIPQSSGRIML
jgi:phage terminase large subunit